MSSENVTIDDIEILAALARVQAKVGDFAPIIVREWLQTNNQVVYWD